MMTLLNWLYFHKQGVEIILQNIFGASVVIWLTTFLGDWASWLAGLVTLSILIMNGLKIYGLYLDNTRKKKELKRDIRRGRRK